jgi:hypothetical protein
MLVIIGGLCCVGFINRINVVAGVRRKRLALSIESNWAGSTRRRRQKPVSETLCLCDSYINIPSPLTYS